MHLTKSFKTITLTGMSDFKINMNASSKMLMELCNDIMTGNNDSSLEI